MQFFFRPNAETDLRRLPKDLQRRIIEKIVWYCSQENPLQFAKRLTDSEDLGEYRFRIGDYRAIFDIDDGAILILHIGHRKEIYR